MLGWLLSSRNDSLP